MKRFTILLGLAVLFLAPVVWADVPKLVNFQGILRDGSGNPVADGSYFVTFRIYDLPAGGTILWADTQTVATTDGLFNAVLGTGTPVPDTVFNDSVRYLGITVFPDAEMTPRQRLTTSGYSFRSAEWTTLGENLFRLNGRVGIGTASPSAETKLHISHTDGDNFGLLIDAYGTSGTEIGLHSGPAGYASLAKNAYFAPGWTRFNDANGAFLQEIEPDGDASFKVAGPGAGLISWAEALMLKSSGNVGIGESNPLAKLHVQRMEMSLPSTAALLNEDIVIEDDDAVLGLYSGTGGTFGSAISLGEIDAGVFSDKWTMYRTKTLAGAKLGFAYGADTSYAANPTLLTLDGPNSKTGISESNPLAKLHVQRFEMGLPAAAALMNEDIIVEDDDAVLGLYSGTGGTYGSAISLGEIAGGSFTNKWSMYRTKTAAGSKLGFSYGADTNYAGNPALMTLDGPNGKVGIGTTVPSAESKLHIRHFDGDNFGLLVDAHGTSGTEIGLHTGPSGYASLAKNTYFNAGWQRFNLANGAFLQQVEPDGDVTFNTAPAAANPISWNNPLTLTASGGVGIGTSTTGGARLVIEDANWNSAPVRIRGLSGTTVGPTLEFDATDGTAGNQYSIICTNSGSGAGGGKFAIWHDGPTNSGYRFVIDSVGRIAIGSASASDQFEVHSADTVATFNRLFTDGVIVSLQQGNATEGTISVSGTTVSYNAFTGSHYGWTGENLERGELVSLSGANRHLRDNPKSEIIYGIRRSSIPNDPSCLGAYLALSEPGQSSTSENPHLVMAVGNGDMWVVDEGRNLQPGDYLISSGVPGHAMRDDEEKYPIGHIVARAAEGVDWGSVSEMVGGRKHKKISVLFGNFVRGDSRATETLDEQQRIIEELRSEVGDLRQLVEKLLSSERKNVIQPASLEVGLRK